MDWFLLLNAGDIEENAGPYYEKMASTLHRNISCVRCSSQNRKGHVIPIPKPNKPEEDGESYRSIALLSLVAKMMEKLLLLAKDNQPNLRRPKLEEMTEQS